jgi:hypothetical protein
MIKTVSSMRCDCGARIRVIGESEGDIPPAISVAECPQCGDEQVIYAAGKILSVTLEMARSQPAGE